MRMGNDGKPVFLSNHAGGILGGISTGQPIVARFAVKPTSSILTPRKTVDRYGNETEIVTKGRHDPCVGIRAVPIGEAMVACVLADHYLRHRGQVGLKRRSGRSSKTCTDTRSARRPQQSRPSRAGEIVVVIDDDDRENEGDLIVAAVALHAGEDGLHHPQHLRHRLHADHRARPRAGCTSRRWSPTTTRRTAPPSPSRSTSSTAPPPASRPRTARRPCATSPTAMRARPTSCAPAMSSR